MNIFKEMPSEQARFIDRAALSIMRSGENDIESVLNRVVGFFSSKKYGWSEAILDQLWYRYPGEVRNQRFCSEEALKNYLICRALSLPVKYYIAENLNRGGIHHELVLLDYEGTTYLVDWDLYKIKSAGPKKIITACGNNIYFDKLLEVPESEVIGRVEALRNSELLLESLKSPQFLYRKYSDRGQLEAYVKYFEKSSQIEFTFRFYPYSGLQSFYFIHRLNKAGKTLKEEVGLVTEENGFRINKIPMMYIDLASGKRKFYPIGDRFNNRLKRVLIYNVLHDSCTHRGRPIGLPRSLKSAYKFLRASMNDKTENEYWRKLDRWFIYNYHDIIRFCPKGALFFFDSYMMQMYMSDKYKKYKDLRKMVADRCGTKNIRSISKAYLTINCKNIGKMLLSEETVKTQQLLCKAIARKSGVAKIEYKPGKIFERMEEIAYQKIWERQPKKELTQ